MSEASLEWCKRTLLVASGLFVWEVLATAKKSVSFLSKPCSISKVCYALNFVLCLITLVFDAWLKFGDIPSSLCLSMAKVDVALSFAVMKICAAIMTIRIWAVNDRDKVIMAILLVAQFGELPLIGLGIWAIKGFSMHLEGGSCVPAGQPDNKFFVIIMWSMPLVFNSLFLFISAFKGVQLREKSGGKMFPVVMTFITDAGVYGIVLLGAYTVNLAFYISKDPLFQPIATPIAIVLTSLMSARVTRKLSQVSKGSPVMPFSLPEVQSTTNIAPMFYTPAGPISRPLSLVTPRRTSSHGQLLNRPSLATMTSSGSGSPSTGNNTDSKNGSPELNGASQEENFEEKLNTPAIQAGEMFSEVIFVPIRRSVESPQRVEPRKSFESGQIARPSTRQNSLTPSQLRSNLLTTPERNVSVDELGPLPSNKSFHSDSLNMPVRSAPTSILSSSPFSFKTVKDQLPDRRGSNERPSVRFSISSGGSTSRQGEEEEDAKKGRKDTMLFK